jgi:hypothetical protein
VFTERNAPPRVVLHDNVDVTTRARAARIQALTGKSLPTLLQAIFKIWETRLVSRLDESQRERYFLKQLSPDECQAIRKRAIEGAADREIFDAADNDEQDDIRRALR